MACVKSAHSHPSGIMYLCNFLNSEGNALQGIYDKDICKKRKFTADAHSAPILLQTQHVR